MESEKLDWVQTSWIWNPWIQQTFFSVCLHDGSFLWNDKWFYLLFNWIKIYLAIISWFHIKTFRLIFFLYIEIDFCHKFEFKRKRFKDLETLQLGMSEKFWNMLPLNVEIAPFAVVGCSDQTFYSNKSLLIFLNS